MHDAREFPQVEITLLGEFSVSRDRRPVGVPSGVARLLALLAVRDRPLLRTTASLVLWPDHPDDRAASCIRNTLWRCRGSLGDVVDIAARRISLAEHVDVDLWRLRRAAASIVAAPEHAVDGVMVDDFVGELLPGWDEEWLSGERERARQQCVHVLEAVCREMTEAGRAAEAIDAGVAAVAIDPLRESAQRVLITAHLAEGNVSEARRQFDGYCLLLRTQLGVEPSPLLTDLVGATSAA